MKRFLIALLITLLIFFSGVLGLILYLTADQTLEEAASLTIAEGSSTSAMGAALEEAGLVRDSRVFRYFAKQQDVDSLFKAGDYTFEPGTWSLEDVCLRLVEGGVSQGEAVWVTIREGLTAGQTFAILEEAGLHTAAEYLAYAESGDFSAYPFIPSQDQVIAPGNRLDGYLFPETYSIDPAWNVEQITHMLLDQFVGVWEGNSFGGRAAELGRSVPEIIIMASLVEKEAQVAEDRPLIAGVFWKRLEISMKLESCATIQFLLGEPKVELLNSDLAIDSPYNVYMYAGLPPAPIACPGLASITAALYPEASDYLYFRARTDGSHRFSLTLDEHTTYHEGDQ